MKILRYCFLLPFLSMTLMTSPAYAGVVVIVNKAFPVNKLSKSTLRRIYLSKIKKIPNTSVIPFPIDQSENSSARGSFNRNVIGMSASQLRKYWAKRIFTGKGGPPKSVSSDRDVIALVKSNKNIIGYVNSSSATSGVKVVYR